MQSNLWSRHNFGGREEVDENSFGLSLLSLEDTQSLLSHPQAKEKKSTFDRFIPNRKQTNYDRLWCQENEGQTKDKPIVSPEMEDNSLVDVNKLFQKQILKSTNSNLLSFGKEESRDLGILEYLKSYNPLDFSGGIVGKRASDKISKSPFKILDAPSLIDDFYLNLVDWSSKDVLAVALGSSLYLWSSATNKVSKLCDTGSHLPITSVAWSRNGQQLAVGTHSGDLQLWDSGSLKMVNEFKGQHSLRIGSLSWTSNHNSMLASGSRDKKILIRDVRQSTRSTIVQKYTEHKQEVCGLKWSLDDQYLASGGNDNKLYIWSLNSSNPVRKYSKHKAAVKAITWSPHQSGLLVSGGGTADKSICMWNINENRLISRTETDSQVCNLLFCKHSNELISTHGYSQNQINIWRTSDMEKLSTLTGHTSRVLYLAMNAAGDTIVTGAGDETLRFWKIHSGQSTTTKSKSLLSGNAIELR